VSQYDSFFNGMRNYEQQKMLEEQYRRMNEISSLYSAKQAPATKQPEQEKPNLILLLEDL
jgi:hypothetical protein